MPSSLNGTGVTFDDGTQLNSANGVGGNYIMQTYTGPATWTKPAGIKAVKVTVVGGGGGGGGAARSGQGGHGGGGGFAIYYIPALSIPGPVAITRGGGGAAGAAPSLGPGTSSSSSGGAGGTSSFGAFVSATGGAGAIGGPPIGTPGAGGSGSGGDINISGGRSSNVGRGNNEGVSWLSLASQGPVGGTGAGIPGVGIGVSGSGAVPGYAQTFPGGAGANGIVIVEEFY